MIKIKIESIEIEFFQNWCEQWIYQIEGSYNSKEFDLLGKAIEEAKVEVYQLLTEFGNFDFIREESGEQIPWKLSDYDDNLTKEEMDQWHWNNDSNEF